MKQNLRKRLECKAEILRQREAQLTAAKKIYRELEHRNTDLQVAAPLYSGLDGRKRSGPWWDRMPNGVEGWCSDVLTLCA